MSVPPFVNTSLIPPSANGAIFGKHGGRPRNIAARGGPVLEGLRVEHAGSLRKAVNGRRVGRQGSFPAFLFKLAGIGGAIARGKLIPRNLAPRSQCENKQSRREYGQSRLAGHQLAKTARNSNSHASLIGSCRYQVQFPHAPPLRFSDSPPCCRLPNVPQILRKTP